jgi:hypothetical protein
VAFPVHGALTGTHPTVYLAVASFLAEAIGATVCECSDRDGSSSEKA